MDGWMNGPGTLDAALILELAAMPFSLKEAPARNSRLLKEGNPDFRDAAFPSFLSAEWMKFQIPKSSSKFH